MDKPATFTAFERLPLHRLRRGAPRLPFAGAELPVDRSLGEEVRESEQERFTWLENQIAELAEKKAALK